MKIKLPWKKLGSDDKPHRAVLTIEYETTQMDEVFKKMGLVHYSEKKKRLEKKKKGGLRKCPGHKHGSHYDKEGMCATCKGFKY